MLRNAIERASFLIEISLGGNHEWCSTLVSIGRRCVDKALTLKHLEELTIGASSGFGAVCGEFESNSVVEYFHPEASFACAVV